MKFSAKIRCSPKATRIVWIKGSTVIDTSLQRHSGSFCDDDKSVLCINNVKKEDEGIYKVEAYNEFGKGDDISEMFKVTGGKMSLKKFMNMIDIFFSLTHAGFSKFMRYMR